MKWFSENNVNNYINGYMSKDELLRVGASDSELMRLIGAERQKNDRMWIAARIRSVADDIEGGM